MPIASILDKPAEGRPLTQRMTLRSAAIVAILEALEPLGIIPAGTAAEAGVAIGQTAAMFMTLVGIYRKF